MGCFSKPHPYGPIISQLHWTFFGKINKIGLTPFLGPLLFYSAVHKAAGLMVPGRSMILPGAIPETPISREWSWRLERPWVVPTASRRLCE